MAGRAIWKGNIQFGETDIAVKLHTAVKDDRIQFHLLHKPDHVRLRQQMLCAYEKKPVPAEEQCKGFEVEDGKYVIVDPGELEQIVPESSRIIEVHEFVKTEQVDPFFLDRPYYLEPDKPEVSGKKYTVLVRALNDLGVEGICTWTMRKRSYLGALQARGNTLRLTTMRYADQVISADSLGVREISLSEKELKTGSLLINQLTAPFEPQKFENEHQKKLQKMIEKKARGQKVAILAPRRLKPTKSDELLRVLEASLKKAA